MLLYDCRLICRKPWPAPRWGLCRWSNWFSLPRALLRESVLRFRVRLPSLCAVFHIRPVCPFPTSCGARVLERVLLRLRCKEVSLQCRRLFRRGCSVPLARRATRTRAGTWQSGRAERMRRDKWTDSYPRDVPANRW